jgi:ATP-binding cassette subfamily C protein
VKLFLGFVIGELRWRLAWAAAVAVALASAEGAGLLLLVPLLASVGLTVGQGPTSGLAASAARLFDTLGVQPSLAAVLGVFLLVSIAHALLYRTSLLLNPTLEQQVAVTLRERLYAAIVRAEWSFFISRRNTDLVHTVTSDVDRASAAAYQLLTLFTGLAVSAAYVAISFWLSPALTGMVVVAGAGVLWVLRHRSRRSSQMGERYADADRRQFHMASESIAGVKVAKSFGAEGRGILIFAEHARGRAAAYLDLLRAFARSKLWLDVSSAVLISGLLFVAVEWFELRGAGLLLLVFVFARVMPRLMALQESVQIVMAGLPSFATVMRLTSEAESQAEHLVQTPTRSGLRLGVRLEGVSYTYGPGGAAALDRLSLSIPAGRTTAIVGASGAGKSTLADLLLGLLRPSAGQLLVDDRPLSDRDIAAWRQSIGYVPQDSFLLHDTVRANLLWAKPDATESEMWAALERAEAAGFLRARTDGLDTVVGDRGVRLSGGERQRLALARALLTSPDLLVLDEATSALDSPNEQQILGAVHDLAGRITTVIITHRLSAIRGADVIHVLENGRLVESGTWPELSSRAGSFSRLATATQGQWPSESSYDSATIASPAAATSRDISSGELRW